MFPRIWLQTWGGSCLRLSNGFLLSRVCLVFCDMDMMSCNTHIYATNAFCHLLEKNSDFFLARPISMNKNEAIESELFWFRNNKKNGLKENMKKKGWFLSAIIWVWEMLFSSCIILAVTHPELNSYCIYFEILQRNTFEMEFEFSVTYLKLNLHLQVLLSLCLPVVSWRWVRAIMKSFTLCACENLLWLFARRVRSGKCHGGTSTLRGLLKKKHKKKGMSVQIKNVWCPWRSNQLHTVILFTRSSLERSICWLFHVFIII